MTIQAMQYAAKKVADFADVLVLHARNKRVTHTLKNGKRIIEMLMPIFHHCTTDQQFYKAFEHSLYQCQVGPTEIKLSNQGKEVFIQGTFSTDMLREFFLVNEPKDIIQIDVQGPKK